MWTIVSDVGDMLNHCFSLKLYKRILQKVCGKVELKNKSLMQISLEFRHHLSISNISYDLFDTTLILYFGVGAGFST